MQAPFGIDASVPIVFFPAWSLLGPFQVGTREAAWGADPLEYYGGFPSLTVHNDDKFKSSLTANATVTWSTLGAKMIENTDMGSKLSLSASFPNVDWAFLQGIYGWSALQYQAWARGELFVNGDNERTVVLYTNNVIEYAIDGVRHFGGDFYAFQKAPLVLHLAPGRHVIDVRLVRDVRSMGGIGTPVIDVNIEFKIVPGDVQIGNERTLVSDVVNGRLASPYGSISVRNNGKHWIEIFDISSSIKSNNVIAQFVREGIKSIAPGQTRPVAFHISVGNLSSTEPAPDTPVTLKYRVKAEDEPVFDLVFMLKLERRAIHEPHKVTHMHPGGIVSYAILRPPSTNSTCVRNGITSAPVLLQFHGAGVEADSSMMTHALDPVPDLCAWVLYPTGVTSWSSDDWHNWGFADVEAAIASVPLWMQSTGWQGIGVDTGKWFVTGHSNGGQGTWYALSHRPDKIFAASPVSGYLSIHSYVPFQFWRTMDPKRRAVIEAAANSYRHELLASNLKGIPIFQQHGTIDDNVPVYHSRLMSQLLSETGWNSEYSEIPGKNHYWDGVMTTSGLQSFYRKFLAAPPTLPFENLTEFELIVANPGDTGSKSGVEVLYLDDPGMLGKIRTSVIQTKEHWTFETANVFAFQLEDRNYRTKTTVKIDGREIALTRTAVAGTREAWKFYKNAIGDWSTQAPNVDLRHRNQLGGIDAILRSNGSFKIGYQGADKFGYALQISRNLHQYYSADAEIVNGRVASEDIIGNIITLTTADSVFTPLTFPIRIEKSKLLVRDTKGDVKEYGVEDADLGVIFVQPHPVKPLSLELVVWGRSLLGLARAARLTPLMTGTGQPDFVILEGSSKWKGVEGTSLGFFDARWNISATSVLPWNGYKVV